MKREAQTFIVIPLYLFSSIYRLVIFLEVFLIWTTRSNTRKTFNEQVVLKLLFILLLQIEESSSNISFLKKKKKSCETK